MSDLLTKISSYNIFNYLLPGILFAVGSDAWLNTPIIQKDILLTAFVCYFAGMVVSRIGSLIIDPIAKQIGFVKYASYPDFVRAANTDPKIEVLSEVNNTYRTLCSLFLCMVTLKIYLTVEGMIPSLASARLPIMVIALLVIFAMSYRKQSAYITKRVKVHP